MNVRRAAAAGCFALLAGCAEDAPPWGQVHIHVDTDLDVPRLANRLRVDLYREGGVWSDSTEFLLDAQSWPTSFTVWSDRPAEQRVAVRLRLYPEGKVRDYRGERFADRPVHVPPFVAGSLDELCASPIELTLGKARRVRRAFGNLAGQTVSAGDCDKVDSTVGSAALSLDVPEAGLYRLAVLDTGILAREVTLQVRRDCSDPKSAVACQRGFVGGEIRLPDLTAALEPGRHIVLVGTSLAPLTGADITLGAARADAWGALEPAEDEAEIPPDQPRMMHDGTDVTPATEPQPELTIDRLALVRVTPDREQHARITLRGACTGTMALIDPTPPHQQPSLDAAETCIDAEGVRQRIVEEQKADAPAELASVRGTFGKAEPCPEGAPDERTACVPGGVFVFGSPEAAGLVEFASSPERLAVIPRFWIDRREVTVADFRAALAEGLAVPPPEKRPGEQCSWTDAPGPFEDFGLSCVPWETARAYCLFRGGDLPTEARWEYVATSVGRVYETRYPWGDAEPSCLGACATSPDPTCHEAVVNRTSPDEVTEGYYLAAACTTPPGGIGPLPVSAAEGPQGDALEVTPGSFVFGLAGGLTELMLDSFQPRGSSCWASQPLDDPRCWEDSAPERTQRGGTWRRLAPGFFTQPESVGDLTPDAWHDGDGFRCSYDAPPP